MRLYTHSMSKLKTFVNHFVIAFAFSLTACGYVTDKPVADATVFQSSELQSCVIDVAQLNNIFKTNQAEQIRCLEENFLQFSKLVRSRSSEAVNEDELSSFVTKFFKGQSESIINGLNLIFQLNMILLKDDSSKITNKNISPLFNFLIEINKEAVVINETLKIMNNPLNQSRFWELKNKFSDSVDRFSKATIQIINKTPGLEQNLNIRKFVIESTSKLSDLKVTDEDIDTFIFVKKMLIGGDSETISSYELRDLIVKLPRILDLFFDAYYVQKENFKSDNDQALFYLNLVKEAKNIIRFNQENFTLFKIKNGLDLAKFFINDYDSKSFVSSIENLKSHFIKGERNLFTLRDLDVTIGMALDFFEKIYYNSTTYDYPENFKILNSNTEIKKFPFKKIPEHEIFSTKRLKELHESFADTAISFRYFRNKISGSTIYDTKIQRNKFGFMEVNIAKWISTKLLMSYGHLNPSQKENNEWQISMDEFSAFLLDTKPILEKMGLWTTSFKTFSRNAVLLADLFQEQSNGNQNIDVNEATEYLGMLLTAINLSDKLSNKLVEKCSPIVSNNDKAFDANCFNDHFYDFLLNDLNYKESLPRLYQYIHSVPSEEALDYLKGVEGFARDDNRPEVPINKRNSTLIIGALLNIETTFVRFDKNSDNILDYDELTEAFQIYKAAIISLANLDADKEKYAKSIFMYMASKMEIPKTGSFIQDIKFASFHSCLKKTFCRNNFVGTIEAKRLNVGKLLFEMVNQPLPTETLEN